MRRLVPMSPVSVSVRSLVHSSKAIASDDGGIPNPTAGARYYWLLLAESHLTQRLFGSMLRRMEALPVPAG